CAEDRRGQRLAYIDIEPRPPPLTVGRAKTGESGPHAAADLACLLDLIERRPGLRSAAEESHHSTDDKCSHRSVGPHQSPLIPYCTRLSGAAIVHRSLCRMLARRRGAQQRSKQPRWRRCRLLQMVEPKIDPGCICSKSAATIPSKVVASRSNDRSLPIYCDYSILLRFVNPQTPFGPSVHIVRRKGGIAAADDREADDQVVRPRGSRPRWSAGTLATVGLRAGEPDPGVAIS